MGGDLRSSPLNAFSLMRLPSLQLPSQLPSSGSFAARGRCFRTDAAGRIALTRDWPEIFRRMQLLPQIALQTRHTYARLIHLGPAPDVTWDETGQHGRDDAGTLRLNADLWGNAWGRLMLCACCDSPGYIDILNARGGDILQFCAAQNTAPLAWARCLEGLVDARGGLSLDGKFAGFPMIPHEVTPQREAVDALPAFLTALGDEQVPVRFLLRTPEVSHLRDFIPRRVTLDYPLLTATDFRSTLQLALSPVRGVAAAPDLSLHLAGPGDTLLLSLGCAAEHAELWRAVVQAAFPQLN